MTDELKHFLALLSSSSAGEDGVGCYLRLYGKLEGFFSMRGVRDPAAATDDTIERAARKIFAGTPVPDVGKYCMGIARNVAHEWLRHERREATAFVKFIEERGDSSDEQVERIDQILKPCFEELAAKDQRLLVDYCNVLPGRSRAQHRRELAARMNTTVLALRMQVTRLRKDLKNRVRKLSKDY